MARRPYIERRWCVEAIAQPLRREVQPDGRIRHWCQIKDANTGKLRYLRVVTLEDGETVHNAFFDRDFEENQP